MDRNHWVQDLFQPTFHLTGEEIIKSRVDEASSVDKSPGRRIQGIYDRVKREFDEDLWNARQKSTQVSESLLEDGLKEENFTDTEKNDRKDPRNAGSDSTGGHEDVVGDDSKLWDSEEMEILRQVFLRTKLENENLKVELGFVKEGIENVTQTLKEKEKHWGVRSERAKGIKRAFDKLLLENSNLKEEVRVMEGRYKSLNEELKDLSVKTYDLRTEKVIERKRFLQEQSERRQVEHALRKLELKLKTGENATVETLKLNYGMEIKQLMDKVYKIELLLEKERGEHKQTKRALDHMRYHFSSLPLKHVDTKSHSTVDGDLLSNLQIF